MGFEVGVVLVTGQSGPERTTARWGDLKALALRAEALGFDTVWTPDELLWRPEGEAQQGMWDGISMAGAVAAVTSRINVGTWVLSALHRNAGIIAKTVETLDEISGGRFIFGLGAGHAWPGQAHAFGLPEDHIFDRFEEALEVIGPLLRDGHANFEGKWHAARQLDQVPRGPRPGRIPIMIGGVGPKGQRLAARYADIWSAYAENANDMSESDRGSRPSRRPAPRSVATRRRSSARPASRSGRSRRNRTRPASGSPARPSRSRTSSGRSSMADTPASSCGPSPRRSSPSRRWRQSRSCCGPASGNAR